MLQQRTYTAGKMGRLDVYANLNETPPDKIRHDKLERVLGERAESRQPTCWRDGCDKPATSWVREVIFDLAKDGPPSRKASMDTSDLTGPVPGFCNTCSISWDGAPLLAQMVYATQPPVAWGFRPNRWFVVFTDGMRIGGECIELGVPPQPIVREEVIHA